jgi:hypothetical protein
MNCERVPYIPIKYTGSYIDTGGIGDDFFEVVFKDDCPPPVQEIVTVEQKTGCLSFLTFKLL